MNVIPITDIEGFQFGHASNKHAATGCTVIICEQGAVAGVDVRGGAPGTRETDLLKSENLVEQVHSVFLSGGSAYGLDVAGGIMNFLEERSIGFDVTVAKVPVVPGAILFDLNLADPSIRPDAAMGKEACAHAFTSSSFLSGNVGAGTGASVGKVLGPAYSMKGGIGSFAVEAAGLKVGAVMAVNCFGDVIDPSTGEMIAGVYKDKTLLNTENILFSQLNRTNTNHFNGNTTIGTVVSNAKLHKSQANKIASIAHDGLARTIRPSHTFVDGDTIFTLTTNEVEIDLNILSALSVYVVEQAVINAITSAREAYGLHAFNK